MKVILNYKTGVSKICELEELWQPLSFIISGCKIFFKFTAEGYEYFQITSVSDKAYFLEQIVII